MTRNYEVDNDRFHAPAYRMAGWGAGIAWHVLGWETEPDEDTHWSGCENRTGRVLAVMVGDDRRFAFDLEDLTPLKGSEYCRDCGQIGCGCNVVED